jgi:nucleoside-diphosphate-sugar epimerase
MILLVTGANGVFGQAIIRTLSRFDEVEKIYAVGRENRVNFTSPKIQFIAADIVNELIIREEIRRELTAVLHAAAETRFSAALDVARRVNVDGLAHVLTFASRCPRLDRFGCLSTIYVAGKRIGRISENERRRSAGFVNAYEQSKFEAEEFLSENAANLPVTIYRLSTIFGDSKTGAIAKPGAIHQALRFFYHSFLPMIPGTAKSLVDLISSDYATAAVTHLFLAKFQPGKTFHLCAAGDALPLGEFLNSARECFLQHRPEWRKRAIEMPELVDLDTFELFVRSVEEVGSAALRQSVNATKFFAPQLAYPKTFDDNECARALAGSGVERPALRDFFPRVVKHLINENWRIPSDEARAGERI